MKFCSSRFLFKHGFFHFVETFQTNRNTRLEKLKKQWLNYKMCLTTGFFRSGSCKRFGHQTHHRYTIWTTWAVSRSEGFRWERFASAVVHQVSYNWTTFWRSRFLWPRYLKNGILKFYVSSLNKFHYIEKYRLLGSMRLIKVSVYKLTSFLI